MSVKEILCSLSAALLVYQGNKGKHIKQKNTIAKKLLLAAVHTRNSIQADLLSIIQKETALYNILLASQEALSKLNKKGELDSIVNLYIKKWESIKVGDN